AKKDIFYVLVVAYGGEDRVVGRRLRAIEAEFLRRALRDVNGDRIGRAVLGQGRLEHERDEVGLGGQIGHTRQRACLQDRVMTLCVVQIAEAERQRRAFSESSAAGHVVERAFAGGL